MPLRCIKNGMRRAPSGPSEQGSHTPNSVVRVWFRPPPGRATPAYPSSRHGKTCVVRHVNSRSSLPCFCVPSGGLRIRVAKLPGGRGVTAITTVIRCLLHKDGGEARRAVPLSASPHPRTRAPTPSAGAWSPGSPAPARLSPRLLAARRNRSVQPAHAQGDHWNHFCA